MANVNDDSSSSIDLCLLVTRGDLASVEATLQQSPQLVHHVRWSGVGPLHRAVANGDLAMTQLLLEAGADVNSRSAWGWYTPLHLACKAGNEELIWLLLDNGANWRVIDKAKKTPLQWAVKAGKASVAYRVDQQLHANAKAKAREEMERCAPHGGLSLASLCS